MARVAGTGGGPTLAVIGHIDEIGLHVTHIDDEGYLKFGQVGGWDVAVLIGQRVRIQTRGGPVTGVIARKPIHLLKDEERKKVPETKELQIDIGAKNGEEAAQLVRIGDVAVIDVGPFELRHDRVVSRALDNRVGCFVAAEAARLVAADGGAPGDVVAARRGPGGDDIRGGAHELVRAQSRCGDRRRPDVRHRPARGRAGDDDQASARLRARSSGGARRCIPACSSSSTTLASARGSRSRSSRSDAPPARTPTPCI